MAQTNTMDAGSGFQFKYLLDPLPIFAFGTFVKVFRDVPHPLVLPFLEAALAQDHQITVPQQTLTNVLWKLQHYLPSVTLTSGDTSNSPELKKWQALAPDANTVRIETARRECPECTKPLIECQPKDRSSISGVHGTSAITNRYKFYSVGAGVQHAEFVERRCPCCSLYYLGGWQYKKNAAADGRSNFGKATCVRHVGDASEDQCIIVPREKSWYAVHRSLTDFITSEFHHSGGTFTSAVLVWSKQHREPKQQELILGPDLTQRGNTMERLADAWYIGSATRLAGTRGKSISWAFTTDGLEHALNEMAPHVRDAHLARVAEHVLRCPRCSGLVLLLVDGKHGARRFICCSLEGRTELLDLGVSVHTGCLRNAAAGHFYCRQCRPAKLAAAQSHLIPQTEVLGIVEAEGEHANSGIRYLVRCVDPNDVTATFDVDLPRTEVSASLLVVFERGLLPSRSDHGNKKTRPAWVKGHRQKERWRKFAAGSLSCDPGSVPSSSRRGAGAALGTSAHRGGASKSHSRGRNTAGRGRRAKQPESASKSRRGRLRRGRGRGRGPERAAPSQPQRRRQVRQARSAKPRSSHVAAAVETCRQGEKRWHELDAEQSAQLASCGIDKVHEPQKKRRMTGGILTAVLQCGLLWDWAELARGETTESVYLFVLRLHKASAGLGVAIRVIGYDNACKLLAYARLKEAEHLPWTRSLVQEITFVLDRFHRDNHTWCLDAMPEVDPETPDNAKLLEARNTEACEEMNAWISGRTGSMLEFTQGHAQIYWWALFHAQNEWLERQADAKRRRFSRGGLKHDPDIPRTKAIKDAVV